MMLVAQITDLHINADGRPFGPVDTARLVGEAVAALNAHWPRPDLVVVTGDLVNKGTPAEYRFARALLEPLEIPWHVIPGNHDGREAMREAFADRTPFAPGNPFLQYAIEGPLRILALDTLVPGKDEGALCPRRLDWLREALSMRPDQPTLVMMHHPPFDCGLAHMDRIALVEGREAFADILRANPQVERVICGHVHRPIIRRFAGTVVSVAPGVAHQLRLDLTNRMDAAFNEEPPAWQLHMLVPDGGLVSHTIQIRPAAGPFLFRDLPPGQ